MIKEITVERDGKQIVIKDSDIDMTLETGQTYTDDTKWLFPAFFLFPIMLVVISTILFCTTKDDEQVVTLFYLSIFVSAVLLIPLCTVACVQTQRVRNKVRLWMDDAVLLKARTKTIGENRISNGKGSYVATAIRVHFSYLGKRHTHKSVGKDVERVRNNFKKFADKELYILYSPKFDKVMLLGLHKQPLIRTALGEEGRTASSRKRKRAKLQASSKLKVVPSITETGGEEK